MAFAAGKEDVSLDTASLDKDVTSVYGTDCEKVKPGEARSTVRVRVTDKASYLAVSSLPDLRNAKVELNEHDFNVMVYNLVDNNIEDMAIRTTKQPRKKFASKSPAIFPARIFLPPLTRRWTDRKTAKKTT